MILWSFFVVLIIFGIAAVINSCKIPASNDTEDKSLNPENSGYFIKFSALFIKHRDTLLRKRKQLIVQDDYGCIDDIRFTKEIIYFIDSVLTEKLQPHGMNNVIKILRNANLSASQPTKNNDKAFLLWWINCNLDMYERDHLQQDLAQKLDEDSSGREFEEFCQKKLIAAGWSVKLTKASGDQGADLIVEKNNIRVCIQCKKSAKPVGNKAVQEAYSAKTFTGTKYAVVVTNSQYTKSAKELAAVNGVILLHHDDLAALDSHILQHRNA